MSRSKSLKEKAAAVSTIAALLFALGSFLTDSRLSARERARPRVGSLVLPPMESTTLRDAVSDSAALPLSAPPVPKAVSNPVPAPLPAAQPAQATPITGLAARIAYAAHRRGLRSGPDGYEGRGR